MADIVVNPANLGLGNVDNTFDLDKPISTATQAALDAKADISYVDVKTRIIDVVQYGFVGDGSDEVTLFTTLLSTIAPGTTIVIPRGTIIGTSGEHELPAGVNISGQGEIRKLNLGAAKHHGLTCLGDNIIEGIIFNGNAPNLTNADITQHTELSIAGPNVTVRDCRFVESSGSSISGRTSIDGFWAHSCTFDEWDDHAIYFSTDAKNIFVENNVLDSSDGRTALKLRNTIGHALFKGNEINCKGRPIELTIDSAATNSMQAVVFANNLVRTDTAGILCLVDETSAIASNLVDGLTISGNAFSQRTSNTASVYNAVDLAWLDQISGTTQTSARNVVIANNIFEDVMRLSLRGEGVQTLENVLVVGNQFRVKNATNGNSEWLMLGKCDKIKIQDNLWDTTAVSSSSGYVLFVPATGDAKATIQGNTFRVSKQLFARLSDCTGLELVVQDNRIDALTRRLLDQSELSSSLVAVLGNTINKDDVNYPGYYEDTPATDPTMFAIGQNVVNGVVV